MCLHTDYEWRLQIKYVDVLRFLSPDFVLISSPLIYHVLVFPHYAQIKWTDGETEKNRHTELRAFYEDR